MLRRATIVLLSICIGIGLITASAAPAGASVSLSSTGSSFAYPAIQDWAGKFSLLTGNSVSPNNSSSVQGLTVFEGGNLDVGASDIPYSDRQTARDPNFPYQYLPDVAGGLAFMYNLTGKFGNRINSLRLNATTIEGIFTGAIEYWDDPAILAINPGLVGDLPHTQITAIYRSDPAGENYMLSDYLGHTDGTAFTNAENALGFVPLTGQVGQPDAFWPTPQNGNEPAQYPNWRAGGMVPEGGADALTDQVATQPNSIGYAETFYAITKNLPIASLLNGAGYYVQPTWDDVAAALTKAILHPDLTQDLSQVYTTTTVSKAYPLSAYSYFVISCTPSLAAAQGTTCTNDSSGSPSGIGANYPATRGAVLGQFVDYSVCAGQQDMTRIGYSPLPPNLVQDDFYAIGRLNGGVQPPAPTPSTCQNPYVLDQLALQGEPTVIGQASVGTTANGAAAPGGQSSTTLGTSASRGATTAGSSSSANTAGATAGGPGSASTLAGHKAGSTAGSTSASSLAGSATTQATGVPTEFQRASGLLDATRSAKAGSPSDAAVAIWIGVLVVVVSGPVTLLAMRRRRGPGSGDGGVKA